MKRLHLILGRGALLATAALAALMVSSASTAQTVSVNGNNTSCTAGTTQLGVNTTGDITITCIVGGTTTFSCTATANPSSIQTGVSTSTSLLSAICNGPISNVAWTVPAGFTLTSGTANSQQIIVNAGTAAVSSTAYQFGVTVTPTTGTAYTNNAIPLTVTAASTGGSSGGTTGCGSSNGTFAKNGAFNPSFAAGGSVQTASYLIPASFMAVNNVIQFTTVQNTGSWNASLGIELVVSPCPGDFSSTTVPAGCTLFSNAESGQLWVAMSAATASKYGAACVLSPPASTAPYYLNVREVRPDLSPSCPSGNTCSFIVQLHWGPY
ncbi:MAG: hypothetical protein WA190_04395 [Usitatibacter sp.]